MSDLASQTPANTYKGLLQVNDYTNGVDATAKYVQDGEGTDSVLAISTTKVGIGSVSPSEKLEVDGDVLISTGGDATLYLGKGAEGVDGVTKIKAVQTGSDTDNLGIAFFVHPSSSGSFPASEAMRIDSDGKVGIGTATPDAITHLTPVSGTKGLRVDVPNGSTAPAAQMRYNGDIKIELLANGDSYFNNGKVGIGVTTPAAPLEIASTTGGVIMPRMNTTQMNAISSPTDGEMIYNTTANKFYGRANGSWVALH